MENFTRNGQANYLEQHHAQEQLRIEQNKKSLHYAYPTSPVADKYDCSLDGCYYVMFNNEVIALFKDDMPQKKQNAWEYFQGIDAEIDTADSLRF